MINTYIYKFNKYKKLENKGITLISLVITIIVLIILAGVSISFLLADNGLLNKAQSTKKTQDVASLHEALELEKTPIQLENQGMVNLEDYLKQIEAGKKTYTLNSVEKLDDENAVIVVNDEYKFLVKDKKNGDVEIIYEGKAKTGALTLSETSKTYTYPTPGTFEVIKNETNGVLTVTSKNEEIATASIEGTTVTVTPGTMSGEAEIVVKSAANGDYAENRAIHTAKVLNGEITIEATPYTGNYDGEEHDAVTNVRVNPENADITYKLNDGQESTDVPKVTGANEYTISITARKEGYTTKTQTITVTIGKQKDTSGNLTLSETSGIVTYPTVGTFTVTNNKSGGKLSVTSSNTDIATASIDSKTSTITITPQAITEDDQKVTITVKSAATNDYEEQTTTYAATIKQGTMTISAKEYSGTYDTKAHAAVSEVSTSPTGGSITYKLDGVSKGSTVPQITDAGNYNITIYATLAGYKPATETKTASISKATGYVTLSSSSGTCKIGENTTITVASHSGTLSVSSSSTGVATVTLNGTNVTITGKSKGNTTITVKSAATTNYTEASANYSINVTGGTPIYYVKDGIVQNNFVATCIATDSYSWDLDEVFTFNKGANTNNTYLGCGDSEEEMFARWKINLNTGGCKYVDISVEVDRGEVYNDVDSLYSSNHGTYTDTLEVSGSNFILTLECNGVITHPGYVKIKTLYFHD